jgi:cytochrome c oxidase subunit 1
MTDVPIGEHAVPLQEVEEVELYHATNWLTKYVFSQDAKVIAIQYACTAIAARSLSSTPTSTTRR